MGHILPPEKGEYGVNKEKAPRKVIPAKQVSRIKGGAKGEKAPPMRNKNLNELK